MIWGSLWWEVDVDGDGETYTGLLGGDWEISRRGGAGVGVAALEC